jgi:hypothetical protein
MYREEVNKYKAKRIGQTDAKVVAPKGKKRKVHKPWCVVMVWNHTNSTTSIWKPTRTEFEKEHDARAYLRKQSLYRWATVWLEHKGEKLE